MDLNRGPEYISILFNTEGLLTETGVLASLTQMFSDHDISILSISTYGYNYILFPVEDHDKFLNMVRKHDKTINYINIANPLQGI